MTTATSRNIRPGPKNTGVEVRRTSEAAAGLRGGSVVASTVLSRSDEFLARIPTVHDAVWKRFGDRLAGTRDPLPADATETCLPVQIIPHRLTTIREACNGRGLRARELSYAVVNSAAVASH